MVNNSINVIAWGISSDMPFALSRRIRLINVFALLASIATLPYIFIFFNKGILLGPLSLFYFICFITTWVWNKYGKFNVAKFWLYTSAHLYLFTTASTFGREAGEHMILIPVLFGAVLVFEFKEKMSLLFAVLFTILTFLILALTDFSLFRIPITEEELLSYYYGNLTITLFCSISIAVFYFYLYGKQHKENLSMIETNKEIERTINYFSTSLFGKNTVDEILWDVAKNCIGRLGFVDCVMYLLDEERQVLVQKAAYGAKNPNDFEIYQPIDIPMGKGIVGFVAKTGEPLIVDDTSKDSRYIADDQKRFSEIAVPLVYNNRVIGVIDSEHPEKKFYTERHLNVMRTISSLCANKVARALADEEREKALKIHMEAEKIKAFDKLKSKLFVNVSHELRTPLTLIMGTIDQHLKSDSTGDWQLLKRHTDRLLRLINQLLDLTKLESGQFKLHPQPGDIMGFLRTILSLFSSAASSRDITLVSHIPTAPLWLNFDHDALEKIFFNLLSNAVKFTRNGTSVALKVIYEEQLVVSVTDQGEGIPEKEKEKIFDRFYQTNHSHKIGVGTGIGLALIKELVELQSGSVTVDSEVGSGTTFMVSLPLERAGIVIEEPISKIEKQYHPADTPEEQSDQEDTDRETILIVEDNDELSAFIKRELQPDFKVCTSFDGAQGIKEAIAQLPDLIISDVMMPETDGLDLCHQLKEHELTSHIPIILLTARADMESKLEGLQTGADDYIVKPFNAQELKTRTKNLLRQRKKLKEKYSKIISLNTNEIVITSVEEMFLKRLLAIVNEQIDKSDFSIQQLCLEMGISRMQMHRKLTALTGHSATSFIRHQRLLRAAELLKSGEAVSQVAYSVGFNSLSYFTRVFKEQFEMTPSEYALQKL